MGSGALVYAFDPPPPSLRIFTPLKPYSCSLFCVFKLLIPLLPSDAFVNLVTFYSCVVYPTAIGFITVPVLAHIYYYITFPCSFVLLSLYIYSHFISRCISPYRRFSSPQRLLIAFNRWPYIYMYTYNNKLDMRFTYTLHIWKEDRVICVLLTKHAKVPGVP